MDFKDMARTAHGIGQNCFHMIWTPKFRCPVFRYANMREICEKALRKVSAKHKIKLHRMCVEPDHVHLFVELPCTMSVSEAFRLLKGGSSFLIRNRTKSLKRYKALWGRGKFYRSVGSVTDEAIEHYITNSHHISNIPAEQKPMRAWTRA